MFYVVFHHFPSANCHDIALSLLRRGLISLGGTSSLLGLVYPSWQVKQLRFKRQEMLLSDLSCCCQLQERKAQHCHPCTTPWRMATLKHHRCGLSSFCGSWTFQKVSFWGSSTTFIFPEAVGFFSLLRHWGSEVHRFNNIETCTVQRKAPVWCTVESPAAKRDKWRCKACTFDWVRRLISKVLEWTTCLRCGTGKPGIFMESESNLVRMEWKTFALAVFSQAPELSGQVWGNAGAEDYNVAFSSIYYINVISGCGWRNYEHVAFLCMRSFSNVLTWFGASSLHATIHDDHHRTASSLTSAPRLAVVSNQWWYSRIIGEHVVGKWLPPCICRSPKPQQVAQFYGDAINHRHSKSVSQRPCTIVFHGPQSS